MVGPNYCKVDPQVSNEWATSAPSQEEPPYHWWDLFDDPLLTEYMQRAATCNNTILMAEANIVKARAFRQVSASALFPQVDLDLNATRSYFSKNGPVFAIGNPTGSTIGSVSPNTGLPFVLQIPQVQNLYNALFDASWEIDLFGKTRRGVEASQAQIEESIETKNDLLLTLFAELAKNYVELRSNQTLLHLLEEKVSILKKNREITRKRYAFGFTNKIPLENIEASLREATLRLPPVRAEIYQGIYAISVLIGAPPECLVDELLERGHLPKVPSAIALGLRSDLLRRRPDVRVQERRLAAATANIGVAVASFFPTLTLVADGGLQSLALSNLFTGRSKTGAIGGDFNTPVFQGGNLIGNLKMSKAQEAIAAYSYQQTMLNALKEAESALVTFTEDRKVIEDRKSVVKTYLELNYLAKERNRKGLVNLLDVLEAQANLNTQEEALLASETRVLVDAITLYKAIGGGF